jgi:hypothetical protein
MSCKNALELQKTENTLQNSEVLFCLHVLEFSLNWCLVGLHYGLYLAHHLRPPSSSAKSSKKGPEMETSAWDPKTGSNNNFFSPTNFFSLAIEAMG